MIRLSRMAVLVAVLSLAKTASAGPNVVDGPIFNPANDHTYYLLAPESWTASESDAISLGGNLVTINNQAENDWVVSTFGSFGGQQLPLWTGFYDPTGISQGNDGHGPGSQHAANFVWVDGTPASFTNWAPEGPPNTGAEPNNFNFIEYYAQILASSDTFGRGGDWNDLPNVGYPEFDQMPWGVVEVVPEPSTLALFGIAGALMSHGRIRRWLRNRRTI